MDTTEIFDRLELVEQRLAEHAAGPAPDGLTEPDEGATERWEAAQVWAHMAEFTGYWQAELEKVVDNFHGTPVPFGRTKDDLNRAQGIEAGRSVPIADLMQQVHANIEVVRDYLSTLTEDQMKSVGLHSTRGELDVTAIVNRFTLDHLEEHADQLDGLRS
jgi:hypothetical protein